MMIERYREGDVSTKDNLLITLGTDGLELRDDDLWGGLAMVVALRYCFLCINDANP